MAHLGMLFSHRFVSAVRFGESKVKLIGFRVNNRFGSVGCKLLVWGILRWGRSHWVGLSKVLSMESFWLPVSQWQSRRKGVTVLWPHSKGQRGSLSLLSVLKWNSTLKQKSQMILDHFWNYTDSMTRLTRYIMSVWTSLGTFYWQRYDKYQKCYPIYNYIYIFSQCLQKVLC